MIEQIYPGEEELFLDKAIAGKTVAYCPILPAENNIKLDLSKADIGFIDNKNADRWDLFPFYSILVSAGWNKNTDVFDPVEMWKARNSPEDKPLNLMHDQKKIVGHIVKNITVGVDLKPIPETVTADQLPPKIHIVTANVLYAIWEDPTFQEDINKIIAGMNDGKWFVSMECLFTAFDYALVNAKGEQKFLQRNHQTSFLTKHLRQYGGTGKYLEYTVGRLLRNITFSAQGIVDKPANPESIISSDLNIFDSSLASLGYINLEQLQGEIFMADNTMNTSADYNDLKDRFNKLSKSYEDLQTKTEKIEAELAEVHNATLAKKEDEIKKEKDEKADALKEVASLKVKAAEDEKKFKEMKDEDEKEKAALKAEVESEKKTREAYEEAGKKTKRSEAFMLADKSLTKEQALALAEKHADLSDGTFDAMIATVANYASRAPQEVTAEKVITSVKAVEESPNLGTSVDHEKTLATDVRGWFTRKNKGSK